MGGNLKCRNIHNDKMTLLAMADGGLLLKDGKLFSGAAWHSGRRICDMVFMAWLRKDCNSEMHFGILNQIFPSISGEQGSPAALEDQEYQAFLDAVQNKHLARNVL